MFLYVVWGLAITKSQVLGDTSHVGPLTQTSFEVIAWSDAGQIHLNLSIVT